MLSRPSIDDSCNGVNGTNSLNLPSDSAYTGIIDVGVSSVQFQSEIEHVLSTYDNDDYTTQKAATQFQNTCFIPIYQIKGVIWA